MSQRKLPEELECLRSRDLFARSMSTSTRSESINVEERSFEAVVASETPAQIFDYRSYEVIDEVLLSGGGVFPDHVPLLANHQRYSLEDQIGSARDFRAEGDKWVGKGFVARAVGDNDPIERIWVRVADGHLRAVSIGYKIGNYVDIPPGKKQKINGRSFAAGERTLRVTTEWHVHELSLTPIGADSTALIRSMGASPVPRRRSFFAK